MQEISKTILPTPKIIFQLVVLKYKQYETTISLSLLFSYNFSNTTKLKFRKYESQKH